VRRRRVSHARPSRGPRRRHPADLDCRRYRREAPGPAPPPTDREMLVLGPAPRPCSARPMACAAAPTRVTPMSRLLPPPRAMRLARPASSGDTRTASVYRGARRSASRSLCCRIATGRDHSRPSSVPSASLVTAARSPLVPVSGPCGLAHLVRHGTRLSVTPVRTPRLGQRPADRSADCVGATRST
jgi:hypothetical protein